MNLTFLYVAALYAGAVALARRGRVDLPWRVVGLFYALVLAFLFQPMTGPYVNVAPDVLKLLPPWSASAPPGFDKYDVSNYELQDIVFQFVPWTHQVHAQWRELRLPLWNELAACGMPLLANMTSSALSPLRLLTIPLPLAYAVTAEAAMKILLALTFTFLYCRKRGYDVLPSIAGAIAFGFGTFIMLWLHFTHVAVAAFLPAVFYAIDLLAERRTFGRFLFAGSLGPLLLAGGHPETAAHIVFFATLYALWLICVERVKFIGTLIAVCVVALLLAMPLLAPFAEILPQTMSYHAGDAQGRGGGTPFSDFKSLALLVHPRIYGERPGPLWGPSFTESVSGFAGILGIGAWFGLVARRRFRERETFFLVAAPLLLLWLGDVPIISAPIHTIFSLALNARMRLLLTFALAIMTAALIQKVRGWPLVFAAGGALGALALVFAKTDFPTAELRQFALETAVPSVIVVAAALLLFIRRTQPIVAAAIFFELWSASHSWYPTHPREDLYPRTPLIDELQRRRGNEPSRIAGTSPLFPNTNALFGFEDIRVHDPMAGARYLELLRVRTKNFNPVSYYQKYNDPDSPLLDEMNVRWFLTEPGVELDRAHYKLVYDGNDGRIFENLRVKPRFYSQRAFVRIAKARGDSYELHVDAPRPAVVLSGIAHWPGWRVTYNDRRLPVRIVNGAFVGFEVPAGNGVVRVRYMPMSFWLGLAVAALTIIAVIIRARWSTRPGSM